MVQNFITQLSLAITSEESDSVLDCLDRNVELTIEEVAATLTANVFICGFVKLKLRAKK